ncbi:diphthine methyltransferase isoform X6 [Musca domestica]|uniref:methylated diphthine methylhydrolase n=1 Tax=Musca domestica TaxID=7370 RepID=A0A9J7DBJ0_MUSDO|nr:diphthine methyltransferase isoform X6 [Musca domestica]
MKNYCIYRVFSPLTHNLMKMLNIELIHNVDTEYSADSVEWCPHKNFRDIFACGTYQLEENKEGEEEKPCQRKGRIYLYEFEKHTKSLKELQRIETAAILDMKWINCNDNELPILATATALGKVELFQLEDPELKLIDSIHLKSDDDNILALSLDWKQGSGENNENQILVSDSKGNISLLNRTNERNMEILKTWHAHNFEAWICAFDRWDQNRVYTGGDDTFLNVYDLRTESRILLNKSHAAGVTCLLSHPVREHVLLTGSYDEHLRTFDTRAMRAPLSEINLQGGIWRIKSDPREHNLMLCACMYHNFSIVHLADLNAPTLTGEFGEHTSICYGADWDLNFDEGDDGLNMATCSFYDHKLCVSRVS